MKRKAKLSHDECETVRKTGKEQAVELWLSGLRIEVIAEKLGIHRATVYRQVSEARCDFLRQNRHYVGDRMLLFFDDLHDTIQEGLCLLADEDLLRSADPERIEAVGETIGALSDRVLALGAICILDKESGRND